MRKGAKVIVIGLDGATWDLLLPWIKKDKLPIFKRLMKNGVWGKLKSTIPPVTGPAWVSFATGVNPGKHNVYDFVKFKDTTHETRLVTLDDIQCLTFYEILSMNDKRSILINLPGTYPPKEINGIIIPDFLSIRPITYPRNINKKYLKNYRFFYDKSKTNFELTKDILDVIKERFEVSKKIFEKETWDLFFVLFSETDWISHHFWHELINETSLGKAAFEIFYYIDDILEWFMEKMDNNMNLIIISDHGFRGYDRLFFINKWLEEKKYLKRRVMREKENKVKDFAQLAFKDESENLNFLFNIIYNKLLKNPQLPSLKNSVFFNNLINFFFIGIFKGLREIDFKRTLAFSPTSESSSVVLNSKDRFEDGLLDRKQTDSLKKQIMIDLKELIDPKNDSPVFKSVFSKEEIYWGKNREFAPDIIVIPNNIYNISAHLGSKDIFRDNKSSHHALEGIFIGYGNDISGHGKIKSISMYDLAPTILYMLSLPVSKEMDGKVVRSIFQEDFILSQGKVKYVDYLGERQRIIDGIKGLKMERRI